jgi:hypothetical protein
VGSGSEGKEKPRKVGKPVRGCSAGTKGVFQAAMESFLKAIGIGWKAVVVICEIFRKKCSGSVTFWYASRSADPYL